MRKSVFCPASIVALAVLAAAFASRQKKREEAGCIVVLMLQWDFPRGRGRCGLCQRGSRQGAR